MSENLQIDHPLLELSEVGKYFGRTVALSSVNLNINERDRWVIFGRNGAGKTSLLRVVSTLMKPSEGSIRYRGQAMKEQGGSYRRQVGFLSHATALYPDLTAKENLSFYAQLFGIENEASRIRDLLEKMGLAQRAEEPVRGLSRGLQQRLALARVLLHQPSILLLDEPFSGLDTPSIQLLEQLLAEMKDLTLLLTSHDLQRGLNIANRVGILDRGKIVYQQSVGPEREEEICAAYDRWVADKGSTER